MPEGGTGGWRERRFTAQDGLSLYFRDYGDPLSPLSAVLCLPGLSRNSRDFHDLAQRLAASGRRVLCPDYRGRGRSDYAPDPAHYHPRFLLDDLRHLLALTGCHRFVAIGTSMGGLMAAGLAVVVPGALSGVVLNDVGPDISADGLDRIMRYVGQDNPQPDRDAALESLRRIMPSLALRTEAEWRAAIEGTFRRGEDGLLHVDWDPRIVEPLRKVGGRPDLWALFGALRSLPVLAFRGENSDVLTPDTFARMGEAHPTMIRITVAGAGHTPSLCESEAVAAIDDFLSGL